MKKKTIKRITTAVLSLILTSAISLGTFSMTVEARPTIKSLENDLKDIKDNISSANAELVSVISQIDELTAAISEKEAEIADLNNNITLMEEAAKKQEETIRLRLIYTYENGSDTSVLTMMLESGSIADFINKVEYANAIYEYDHNLLETYEATKKELNDVKEVEQQAQDELKTQKDQLAATKTTLNNTIAQLKASKADVEQEIKKAKEEAARKERERKERLRKEQEAARARLAAEEAKRLQNGGSGSGSSLTTEPGGFSQGPEAGQGLNPAVRADGNAIVAYAKQFVGNPYVWGGNSLTNGCDCSGFTKLVYEHFGIKTPRYSQSFLDWGHPVSFENILPGDVVVYPGHVAIYAGGGIIVEAQSPKAGITIGRSVQCHNIKGIRRY